MLRPALVLLCLWLAACSSDEESPAGDSNGSADVDGSSDGDITVPDAGTVADADAGESDAETDTGTDDPDADADTGSGAADADADSDTGIEPGPTLEAVCDALGASTCAAIFACDCPTDTVLGFSSEADCVSQRTAECLEGWSAEQRAAFEDGTLVSIAANVDACIAGRETQFDDCTFDENVGDPRCSAVFSERAPIGEPCLYGGFAPCAGGTGYCDDDGTCRAKEGEGQVCASSRECTVGLICPDSTCITPVAAGGACTASVECVAGLQCLEARCSSGRVAESACESPLDCAAGLGCEAGTCADAWPVGTPCNDAFGCNRGLSCVYNPGARTCTAGGADGESCAPESPCANGLFCGSDGKCAPLGASSDACEDSSQCADGLVCSESVCAALPGLGEPCLQMADAFCERGLGCNFTSGNCEAGGGARSECLLNGLFGYVCDDGFGCNFEESGSFCIARSSVGGPCTNDSTCVDGLFCNYEDNTCETRRGPDAPCPASNECADGLLCDQVGDTMRCITPPALGDPCYNLCDEGLTCTGIGGLCASSACTAE